MTYLVSSELGAQVGVGFFDQFDGSSGNIIWTLKNHLSKDTTGLEHLAQYTQAPVSYSSL